MNFFEQNKIIYYMRLPMNRKARSKTNSIEFKIADNLDFRLKRNTRSKTFEAYFGKTLRYITAEKRLKRSGEYEAVYIVSNEKADSKETILTYKIRWTIEMCFRTSKQKLGLDDCLARSIQKQTLHIYSSFVSYGILESIKFYRNLDCPEDALRYLQMVKYELELFGTCSLDQYFCS
jgi:hypothetical protein